MNFRLQLLHASDMEGGGGDLLNAPNFAAIVDHLENREAHSIFLSSGDLVLPGPYLAAAADASMQSALQLAAEKIYGLAPGGLSGLKAASGRVETLLIDLLEAQAVTLGNHEFDMGTSLLIDMVKPIIGEGGTLADVEWVGSQFPYLSANLDFSGDAAMKALFSAEAIDVSARDTTQQALFDGAAQSRFAPVVISEVGGEQIGIIGLTTQILESISSPGGVSVIGSKVNDMQALADIVQPLVDTLEAQGVNKIVLASHLQQIQFEEELAPLLDGIDIIMAGGSNALLANEQDIADGMYPGAGEPYKQYPILTRDAGGDAVAIINTDGGWRYVGQLVVEFDEEGRLVADSITPQSSGVYAATDAQVEALWGSLDAAFAGDTKGAIAKDLVDAVASFVSSQDGNVQGLSSVYLAGERGAVRTEETNLGNLTAEANLWYARQVDDTVQVSFKNGGGIREPIGNIVIEGADGEIQKLPPAANEAIGKPAGGVSQLDVASSLRFNNDLSLVTISRESLVKVIEHAVAASAEDATPGQFAQVAGISYSFDWSQPAGSRIQSAAIVDENGRAMDVLVANGRIVGDPAGEVRVVTLSFLTEGGDGYPLDESLYTERVDLMPAMNGQDGTATFAVAGTEQDAFAEYLQAKYSQTPFDQTETPVAQDTRIQNLAYREDAVLKESTDALLRLYKAAFDRDADGAGLAYWMEAGDGLDLVRIAENFVASDEFVARGVNDHGAFIDSLYQNVLEREADAPGKDYWMDQMADGASAAVVMVGFSESAESLALYG